LDSIVGENGIDGMDIGLNLGLIHMGGKENMLQMNDNALYAEKNNGSITDVNGPKMRAITTKSV